MPKFCLLDLRLVLQCLPFSIVTERSARGGARMAPSTDGSLLWSARLLTVLPAADSCFGDGNGIPLPPRCQRSRWLLIPDTTRSSLGLMQRLPSELSACGPGQSCTQATAVPDHLPFPSEGPLVSAPLNALYTVCTWPPPFLRPQLVTS